MGDKVADHKQALASQFRGAYQTLKDGVDTAKQTPRLIVVKGNNGVVSLAKDSDRFDQIGSLAQNLPKVDKAVVEIGKSLKTGDKELDKVTGDVVKTLQDIIFSLGDSYLKRAELAEAKIEERNADLNVANINVFSNDDAFRTAPKKDELGSFESPIKGIGFANFEVAGLDRIAEVPSDSSKLSVSLRDMIFQVVDKDGKPDSKHIAGLKQLFPRHGSVIDDVSKLSEVDLKNTLSRNELFKTKASSFMKEYIVTALVFHLQGIMANPKFSKDGKPSDAYVGVLKNDFSSHLPTINLALEKDQNVLIKEFSDGKNDEAELQAVLNFVREYTIKTQTDEVDVNPIRMSDHYNGPIVIPVGAINNLGVPEVLDIKDPNIKLKSIRVVVMIDPTIPAKTEKAKKTAVIEVKLEVPKGDKVEDRIYYLQRGAVYNWMVKEGKKITFIPAIRDHEEVFQEPGKPLLGVRLKSLADDVRSLVQTLKVPPKPEKEPAEKK